jgi:hypothetical protein
MEQGPRGKDRAREWVVDIARREKGALLAGRVKVRDPDRAEEADPGKAELTDPDRAEEVDPGKAEAAA